MGNKKIGRPKKYLEKMFRKPQLLNEKQCNTLAELADQYGCAEQNVLSHLMEKKVMVSKDKPLLGNLFKNRTPRP